MKITGKFSADTTVVAKKTDLFNCHKKMWIEVWAHQTIDVGIHRGYLALICEIEINSYERGNCGNQWSWNH